jgi:hypothetical protein
LKKRASQRPEVGLGARGSLAKQKFEVPEEAIEGNVISFDAFRKKK